MYIVSFFKRNKKKKKKKPINGNIQKFKYFCFCFGKVHNNNIIIIGNNLRYPFNRFGGCGRKN